uniref:DUF4218 domain-containing protein n=1 Tax=Nicotiana tabacum TaxID=4097 RepID=A0A1S4B3V6_TOBAC|nr:PREDICTED: uncharacterized protein LOC107804152 [Nicotiana tabacum]
MAWKSFDYQHPTFPAELRNVRLGLASDGFQPYGNMSTNHSIWPVVLVPYNLPPWDCMKNSYFMMTLLIPGLKCPGNDIDVYLQPMIEELKELWDGVETYDAYSQSNFMMRATVMWTINDFHAYGNLSGWSIKGKLACPCFHKDTHSNSLRSKLCYMGHRRFLPMNHPRRKNKRLFDRKVEMGVAPSSLSGDEALSQLQGLGNVTYGKGQKWKRDVSNNAYNWRKKKRNVSDNIISTVMNMVGKTKDTLKSRYDLVDLGIRQGLHPIEDGNNVLLPAACYALSPQEKLKEVSEPIIELGKFFKNLCSKSLTIEDLDILEAEIAVTLCKLQIIFPPTFFDVMIHLPIHLAREAKLGGPVQYRWMYLRILKSYVRNLARPEGSIAEGHASDELISLAVGPGPLVHRYSTLMVNEFRFQTKDLESRRKTQNSGVLVRGDDSDSKKEYCGVLEDIYELSYPGNRKVYLFKCHWWNVAHLGKGYKIDKYDFTSVNTRCVLSTNEPFMLASQSEQVFYLNDMIHKE